LFSCLFAFKVNAQCTTFIIDETDVIYEFSFIQESIQESDSNGVEFISYIETNLPLCGDNSLNGEGCFQVQLMNPSAAGADYNYADIGFSTANFNMFTEEQWFSDPDGDGCLLNEDCDGDINGWILDPSDPISGINNPYDIPILDGTESTFYLIISFYCSDDPTTFVEEDTFVCQEEVV